MQEPLFEIKEEKKGENHSLFIISPLEKGYGDTLGNSLRRVLLEYIQGAAITSVKIAGVRHKFSGLKGLKEDIVEFVLNLKKVRISYKGDKPLTGSILVVGPGEVKAKDIKLSAEAKIVNPDLVLAHLSKGAKLEATVEIQSGRGYSLFEEREVKELGLIPVDAIFSPVLRVNYLVEETRVGRLTNYDKLILDVFTDGTITPKDAVVQAAKILRSYFDQIISPKKVEKEDKEEEKDTIGPVGVLSVEEIGLPTRVANALVRAGYETVKDLVNAKREDLVKVRNLGEKSVKIIELALKERGVGFKS